jgi:hypothetical protein
MLQWSKIYFRDATYVEFIGFYSVIRFSTFSVIFSALFNVKFCCS